MDTFESLFNVLWANPKGALLMLIAFFNLIWIIYAFLIKKRLKENMYKGYFFYAFFVLLWVITNAYFQSGFSLALGQGTAKVMALLANITSGLAIASFYYFTSLIRFQNKQLPRRSWLILLFLGLVAVLFNVFPGVTVQEVLLFENGDFELIFGPLNTLFFVIGLFGIFASFFNFTFAIKKKPIRIEHAKIFYILFGVSLMYGSVVIFHILLPALSSFFPNLHRNFDYVWIPPVLSILDVLLVGYAVLAKRFIDVRLFISNLLKVLIAFTASISLSYLVIELLILIFGQIQIILLYFLSVISIIFIYNFIHRFLSSHSFNKLFGVSNTQHIRQVIANIKEKNKVYTTMVELENDLKKSFTTSKRTTDCHLILMNNYRRAKYPKLTKYLKEHKTILVTEEIKFVESERDTVVPFLEELESLGGVCLPLFSPNKKLIALFTLGRKQYNHLYSKEEIKALEDMGSYLSMLVNDILYSEQLKKQVQRKTKQLTKTIQQTKRLVEQQADFIAITAHEFRTPLSIAIFKLEDLVKKIPKSESTLVALDVVQSALMNLKDLTQNLFNVQQYDLKKVKIKKTKLNVNTFMEDIHRHFSPLMQQKGLNFTLENTLKKAIYFNVDAPQLRQVLNNLLTNAYKFTPDGGRVTLRVQEKGKYIFIKVIDNGLGVSEDVKETIFKKFRTVKKGSGIGLGLYICKKIVELHQGKLWVEDSPKGGAVFCIQLAKAR